MSAHTPGPWVWHCDLGDSGELLSAHGTVLAHAHYEGMWFGRYIKAEDEANARLIAAAPELLDALRVLVENGGIGPEEMFHAARAAIAKATGETK